MIWRSKRLWKGRCLLSAPAFTVRDRTPKSIRRLTRFVGFFAR